jgi:hypothetical protein
MEHQQPGCLYGASWVMHVPKSLPTQGSPPHLAVPHYLMISQLKRVGLHKAYIQQQKEVRVRVIVLAW